MKTIKFHQLNTLKSALPLGLAICLLFVSYFEMITASPSALNSGLSIAAYLIIALHLSQTLWYNYYVSYNKKGITVRLSRNILKERSFQFKHLKNVSITGEMISLTYRNKEEQIDLKGFDTESQQQLFKLLKQS